MSGGASGLGGYVYQQHYVAFRVLASIASEVLDFLPLSCRVSEFGIEDRSVEGTPVWDVRFEQQDRKVHFRECKDTEITKADRVAFYSRVRKELGTTQAAEAMVVGWVTDPDKQGAILSHLAGMSRLVGSCLRAVPDVAPSRVDSAEDALDEALFHLCGNSASDDESLPAVPVSTAHKLLEHLIVDRFRMEELSRSVELLATGVFEQATGEVLRTIITGELTETIRKERRAHYKIAQFKERIGTLATVVTLTGTLRRLLVDCSAIRDLPQIPKIHWSQLPVQQVTQWPLESRVPNWTCLSSSVLIGSVGSGKTVSSLQAFVIQSGLRERHHVLRVEANAIEDDAVRALPQLACILCAIGPSWLAIDGLDEIDRNKQTLWRETINRLLPIPQLTLFLTARWEVVAAQQWLQNITTYLREVHLDYPTEQDVRDAFRSVGLPVPANVSLVRALRNPFLFTLYARVVGPTDMPLERSGEITGFAVIEAFWLRAVGAESIGHRAVGDAQMSSQPKIDAVVYLVRRSLDGQLAIVRDGVPSNIASGIQMLIHEGVVVPHGGHAIRWAHDWLREYAIINYLVASVATPDMRALAATVVACSQIDEVLRVAAIGGIKWAVAHPDWGLATDYLARIWEHRRGLARDALAVVIESGAASMRLAALPVSLLIEAVLQAAALRAPQWADQIAGLPSSLFSGPDARALHKVITRYETEVAGA